MSLARLVQQVQQRLSPVELIHKAYASWPIPPIEARPPSITLKVAILDSSFNPPTRAHLALASHPYTGRSVSDATDTDEQKYDALLLLLSVRNVDKTLKPTDATYMQRLEMMKALGKDLERNPKTMNYAIGIVDEPTFVGKASILRPFILNLLGVQQSNISGAELTFMIGMDTLERLFAPRYYGGEEAMHNAMNQFLAPDEMGCRVVCARRALAGVDEATQEADALDKAKGFISKGRVLLVDIGEAEKRISSSQVRSLKAGGDERWQDLVPPFVKEVIIRENLYPNDV